MIRSVLDMIDSLDDREPKIDISIDGIPQEEPPEEPRFASVLKMLSDRRKGEYANSPNEIVADVEDIGSFGDLFQGGPTQLDRDETKGRAQASSLYVCWGGC